MSISKRLRSLSPTSCSETKKARTTNPTRFLILSDTHNLDLPSTLPACDVLLHCGDLTEDGTPESLTAALTSLGKIPASLRLVIAGNHEIYPDEQYCTSQGGSAADMEQALRLISSDPASIASQNGITFLEEGTYTFALASGPSFIICASPYGPAYGLSAFQYPSSEDRFNPAAGTEQSRVPEHVDIIMTHGPARYILDGTSDGQSAGCEHLRRAVARVRPKLFCFGHVHHGYGAQRLEFDEEKGDPIAPVAKEWVGKNQARKKGYACLPPGSLEDFCAKRQTLAVNAAMEGEKGVRENEAWGVDIDL